jgi:hypothetical protein
MEEVHIYPRKIMTYIILVLACVLTVFSFYILFSLLTGEIQMKRTRGLGIIVGGPLIIIAFFKRIRSILAKEPLIKFDDEGVHIYQWNGYIVHKWAELKDLDEESFNLITVKNKVISLPSKMLDYSADEIMTLFYDRLYYYNKETNN